MQKISALLLAVLVLLSLASCSFGTSSSSDFVSNTASVSSDSSYLEQSSSDGTSSNKNSSASSQTSSATHSKPNVSSNTSFGISSLPETSSNLTSSGSSSENSPSDNGSKPPNNIGPVNPELYSCYSALSKNQKIIYSELLAAGQ